MNWWNKIASRLGWPADRIEQRIALARGIVTFERAWPALWPASGLVGVWCAAGLLGGFGLIPAWLHLLALLGFLAGLAVLILRQFGGFAWPQWRDGARRLELDSTLSHRPISEGQDALAAGRGDRTAEALWRAHLRAALARIGTLRLRLPRSALPEKDPHALRYAVLLLLAAGFLVAGAEWPARLAGAFVPDFGAGMTTASLDGWINPPAYTGAAPVYLARGQADVTVPAGSQMILRIHAARGLPRLDLDHGARKPPGFRRAQGDGEYAGSVTLTANTSLGVLADGQSLGHWRITVIPDRPPAVAFAGTPSRTERNATAFPITASDDYGIAHLSVTLTPLGGIVRTPLVIELPVEDGRAKHLKQTVYKDLTGHPYAGARVSAVLTATDAAGQSAVSKPVTFTLPQRLFTDPLARALIEQRRDLVLGDLAAIPNGERTLNALTIAPERFYEGKEKIYLAIRAAYAGLAHLRERADLTRVEDLLWDTALALDQHGSAQLAEQLRALQAMISQALTSGAPQDFIAQLLERYNQLLQQYLRMLAENGTPSATPPAGGTALGEKDLQDMLKAIQELSQTGARDKAAQMMALLQNLIENLKMQTARGGGNGAPSAQDKAMADAAGKLGDLMGRQRELLDKTYRQGQNAGNPADGGAPGLSAKQGQLKDALGHILKGLGQGGGKAPKSLGEAGRAMGEAQGALGAKDFDGATQAQKRALEDLRKGVGEMAEAMAGQSGKNGKQAGSSDPFGRPEGARGAIGTGDIKLPDRSTLARAREILQELRKRAGERGRPKEELDYIDRLLKQF